MRDTREVKASGLQGEASPEIIEIIDDDVDAFGIRAPSRTIHDTGGPRWVGPVAAAALFALIGYGVATSASSGAPKVTPISSTSLPTTTQPAPTTTVAPQLVPYYQADPPSGYAVSGVNIHDVDPGYFGDSRYELWAADGATATTGSWFSIEAFLGGGQVYAPNSYRVETGQQTIGISHTTSRQSVAQFAINTAASVTLRSFGFADADLIRLAESITVDQDGIELTDRSLIQGYQIISTTHPLLAVQGNPAEEIYYESTSDITAGISLTVSPRLPPREGGGTLDRQIALRFFLEHSVLFGVDGHSAVAGEVIGQDDYAVATWIARDHVVTIAAALPVAQLITIARTVHEVTQTEWDDMKFQAATYNSDHTFGNFDQTQPLTVSYGTDGEAQPWTVDVVIASFPNQQQIFWGLDNTSGFGSPATDTAKIETLVDNDRTYVLANLPRAVAPTASLQIIRDGVDPVVVPFIDANPDFDRKFAAYAFSEATPYTAQIVGDDGGVLATWPSG